LTFAKLYERIIRMKNIKTLYCDGGVIWDGTNGASKIGGTWAYIATDEKDEMVLEASGFVKLEDRPTTNNHTEFIAATYALEAMPLGWSGTLASDSKITLGRLFEGEQTKNLPNELVERAQRALDRLGAVTPKHLDGHPTAAHLEAGIGKNGNPVSKWQDRCDKLCGDAKEPYALPKKKKIKP
jgi:ribonuclease HI